MLPISSGVAHASPILLHEIRYNHSQGWAVSDGIPVFRIFYGINANSPPFNTTSADIIVALLQTPQLPDGFTGSFVFNSTTDADWAEFATRITDFDDQLDVEGLRLGHGIAKPTETNVAGISGPETGLGILASLLPGSELESVRFDVDQFEFTAIPGSTGGEYTFNVNVSFFGQPIPEPSTLLLLASGLAGLAAWRRRKAA